MCERFTVWVTTPPLGAAVLRWLSLPEHVEHPELEVRRWGNDDGGRGSAMLRVRAESESEAVSVARLCLRQAFGDSISSETDLRTVPGPHDYADFDDAGEEEHVLRWVRSPCTWSAYAPGDSSDLLQVHYVQAGATGGPSAAIAEAVVSEVRATVAISLFERALAGTYPDGGRAASPMAAVRGCLQVRLRRPLSQRRVIDGTTGLPARRLDPRDPEDRRALDAAATRGCPIWDP